jgi:Tfp pilus assembly protein PilW
VAVSVRGTMLVELLVGAALALGVLAVLAAAVGGGGRALAGLGARAEGEDIAALAVEALAVDVRRAGWDPTGAGVSALTDARPDRCALAADLDADGAVNGASEEAVAWVCGPGQLSRIVGSQSLPAAGGVVACAIGYLGADGAPLAVPAGGLDAAGRAAVRAVTLDVALRPTGLRAPTGRHVVVAFRGRP